MSTLRAITQPNVKSQPTGPVGTARRRKIASAASITAATSGTAATAVPSKCSQIASYMAPGTESGQPGLVILPAIYSPKSSMKVLMASPETALGTNS